MITHTSNGDSPTPSETSLLEHFAQDGMTPEEFLALKPSQLRAFADLRDNDSVRPRSTASSVYCWAVYIAGVLAAEDIIHLAEGDAFGFENFELAVSHIARLLEPIVKPGSNQYPRDYIDVRNR